VAALDGQHVAPHVRRFLDGQPEVRPGFELRAETPFRWVAPQIVRPGGPAPSRSRLLLWCDEFHNFPAVKARQNGREIGSVRLAWPAAPGRVFRVPFSLVANADPAAGPVTLGL
jgi:hypothetical protein